jgi:predicted transglutaminase-like cysteine proteinase
MHFRNLVATIATAILLAAIAPLPAAAVDGAMLIGAATSAPIGHVEFCRVHPQDCEPFAAPDLVVSLTAARWDELSDVNLRVNAEIAPLTDREIYGVLERWEYPAAAGDCEDFALLKRQVLIELGWPPSALLMTVVRDEVGDGHAVLTVRTSLGDLILDNRVNEILPWDLTPYGYVKRQSTRDAAQWDTIADHRVAVAVETTGQ